MSIYFFYGQEEFFIDKEIKKIKSKFLKPEFISMNFRTFDNPCAQDLLECCENAPLMFGDMVNIIHIDKYVLGAKMSLTDEQLSLFDALLKKASDNVHLVFVCKIPSDEAKKPDARKKFFKILTNYANTKEFPKFKPWQKEVLTAISDLTKEHDLKISSSVCSYMVEQMGTDMTLMNSEIEKLKSAIYPRTTVETDDIKNFCISNDDVFELVDMLVAGNKDEIIRKYVAITEKKHPLEVFSVVQGGLSRYIFIKTYTGKASAAEIGARLNNMHEFVVKKSQEKLAKISLSKLLDIKRNLTEAEYKYKTGQALLPELLLEVTLLE